MDAYNIMGSKKKLSLKQIKNTQKRKSQEVKKRKTTSISKKEKPPGIIPPDINNEKRINELKTMRFVTANNVASRFNIRISTAKDFLKRLEEKKLVTFVAGSHKIKIYKVLD